MKYIISECFSDMYDIIIENVNQYICILPPKRI